MELETEEKASETTAENMKYAPVVMQRNFDDLDLDLDLHLCGSLASYVSVYVGEWIGSAKHHRLSKPTAETRVKLSFF